MKCSRCIVPFFLTKRVLGCSPKGAIKAQPSSSRAASLARMVRCWIIFKMGWFGRSTPFVRDGVAEDGHGRGGAEKSGGIHLRVGHFQIGRLRVTPRVRAVGDGR